MFFPLLRFPIPCVAGVRIDFRGGPHQRRRIGPCQQNTLAPNDEDLVGFELSRDRANRSLQIVQSTDGMRCRRQAAIRWMARLRSPPRREVRATILLAARLIRRRTVCSEKSTPSVITNGDDRRKRVMCWLRLVSSVRSCPVGRRSSSSHSATKVRSGK